MVSSITDSHSSNILAGISPHQTTPSGSTDSFVEQLTSALEGYLAKSGGKSNLQIDVKPAQSQDSGVRQFTVTVKDSNTPSGQTPEVDSTAASDTGIGVTFPGFASVYNPAPAGGSAAAASASGSSTSATSPDASGNSGSTAAPAAPPMNEVDAYWAAQPLPVQQLRDIPDLAERSAAAQQLADQGYTIDKAIMVWGWDPLKTMLTRKMYGYTWAPSFNQGNVSTPGITLIGQTPYDPKNPPPGSIAVNTDFAKGTEITDPWCASQLQANT